MWFKVEIKHSDIRLSAGGLTVLRQTGGHSFLLCLLMCQCQTPMSGAVQWQSPEEKKHPRSSCGKEFFDSGQWVKIWQLWNIWILNLQLHYSLLKGVWVILILSRDFSRTHYTFSSIIITWMTMLYMHLWLINLTSAKQEHATVLRSNLSLLSWVSYSLYQPRENVRQQGRSQRLLECPENLEWAASVVARRARQSRL